MQLECNTKRICAIACPEKKLFFHTKFCEFREKRILKIALFHWIKELLKSNQSCYGVSHVCLESKTKKMFVIACLDKNSYFNRKYRLIRLFYFKKYRNFIGSRSCSK